MLNCVLLLLCCGLALAYTNSIIFTVAGNGNNGYNGQNIPAVSALLKTPYGVVVDKYGNLYIADTHNHRVRKVDTSGMITTFAGTNTSGYNGDSIPFLLLLQIFLHQLMWH